LVVALAAVFGVADLVAKNDAGFVEGGVTVAGLSGLLYEVGEGDWMMASG
jgi:hypothetical protein